MKPVNIGLISLVVLTIFFGTKNMTVEAIAKGFVDKSWGVINLLFADVKNPSTRSLPQNQGDDSEQIIPIEQLEEVK